MHLSIKNTRTEQLTGLVKCYCSAFPDSLATAFGDRYVFRTMEWFLSTDQNFLFHIIDTQDGKVIGFCGGLINDGVKRRGSASEMIQFAFEEGVRSILRKPWILFHREMRGKYALALRNLIKRFNPKKQKTTYEKGEVEPYVGLVVIGVDSSHQNKGISKRLLAEFEERTAKLGYTKMTLSVKANNAQAIRAYQKYGWFIHEYRGESLAMIKTITIN